MDSIHAEAVQFMISLLLCNEPGLIGSKAISMQSPGNLHEQRERNMLFASADGMFVGQEDYVTIPKCLHRRLTILRHIPI